ncbi:MAG: hypothetical protein ACI4AE_01525 [Candidatus Cryptobacteroides sp.]
MVNDKHIRQFFRQHKPVVGDGGAFMKEVVRQIDAMPTPAAMQPDFQKEDCIRIVLEVSKRDLRAVRLAVGAVVAIVILSAVTAAFLPAGFIPTDIFTFK